jgi:hypothetical protein
MRRKPGILIRNAFFGAGDDYAQDQSRQAAIQRGQ